MILGQLFRNQLYVQKCVSQLYSKTVFLYSFKNRQLLEIQLSKIIYLLIDLLIYKNWNSNSCIFKKKICSNYSRWNKMRWTNLVIFFFFGKIKYSISSPIKIMKSCNGETPFKWRMQMKEEKRLGKNASHA